MMRRTRFTARCLGGRVRDIIIGKPTQPSRRFGLRLFITGRATHRDANGETKQFAWCTPLPTRLRGLLDDLRADLPELRDSLAALWAMLRTHDVHTLTAVAHLLAQLAALDPDVDVDHHNNHRIIYEHDHEAVERVAAMLADAADAIARGRGASWADLLREAGNGLPTFRWFREWGEAGSIALSAQDAMTELADTLGKHGSASSRRLRSMADLFDRLDVDRPVWMSSTPAEALAVLRTFCHEPSAICHLDRLIQAAEHADRLGAEGVHHAC